MNCLAHVVRRSGCLDGQCYQTRDVRLVRWAPTPLTTQVIKGLCTTHRKMLEAGRRVEILGRRA